jgi:hypothetical protein
VPVHVVHERGPLVLGDAEVSVSVTIGRPEYCCGPPAASHPISVTRYVNPDEETR